MTTALRLSLVLALAIEVAAAPREFNVALVGDSLAYGAGDEERKGIAGRIVPELRTRGVENVVTTNLARTGATTRDLTTALQNAKSRQAIERADAIILSIGANDIRSMLRGEEPLRSPLLVAGEVLGNMETIVADLRRINRDAHIVILGAYVPIADGRAAEALEPLVAMWDVALMSRFEEDERVSVVRLSDIVNRPERLSRDDSFHPGGEAYQETARRIAGLLTNE
ncbi:MAG TPA: GDSL-type esterase/lipase family protein [Thermoanaerobaculia bacterium]